MKAEGHEVRRKIPVPSNYRNAAKYLRQAIEEKKCIKQDLLNDKHFRTGRTIMHRLMVNLPQINAIIKHIQLTTKEPRMNEWMARALICELLFGSGNLVGQSLPVETIRRYDTEIRAAFEETKADNPPIERFKEPRFVRINTSTLNLEGAKRMMQEEGWILVDEEFTSYLAFLDRVRALGDFEYMVDFHFNDMLVFPNSAKGYWARAEHLREKFFLQNKACLVPTYLLNPAKKSVVLDMCAAPGMKATHLASLMKNKGRLYAVERDEKRYSLLCKYAADFGVIKTIHGDCLSIYDEQVPGVKYVLVDPSCSGSGMLNRLSMPEPVDQERLFKLAGLQYKLLSHAMNAYPNVTRIVYSTCSLHVEENEQVVQGILRHNAHFKLIDARQELGKEWLNVGSPEYLGIGERCLYARPEIDLTIGMFVAVFERCAEDEVNELYEEYENHKQTFERVYTWRKDSRNHHQKEDAEVEAFEDVAIKNDGKQPKGKNNPETETGKKKSKTQDVQNEAQLDSTVDDGGKVEKTSEPTEEEAFEDVPIKSDGKERKRKNNPEPETGKKKSKTQDVQNEDQLDSTVDDGGKVENTSEPTEEEAFEDVLVNSDGKERKRKKKKSNAQDVQNEDQLDSTVDDGGKVEKTSEPTEEEAFEDVLVNSDGKERKRKKKKSKAQDVQNEDQLDSTVDDGGEVEKTSEPTEEEAFEDVLLNSDGKERKRKKKKSKAQDVQNEDQLDSTVDDGGKVEKTSEPTEEEAFEDVPIKCDGKERKRKNNTEPENGKKKSKAQDVQNEDQLDSTVDDGGKGEKTSEPTEEEAFEDVLLNSDGKERKRKKKKSKAQDVQNEDQLSVLFVDDGGKVEKTLKDKSHKKKKKKEIEI